LKYSDVMVNYFSTLGLEAAICDVPTIHIGYDKFTYHISPMAWSSTGARNTHNQDQQRRAASKVVTSDEELVSAIETYLQNRALDREERREYALSECGYLDGKSMARLAELVAETTATFPKRQA
jgi:CDP-glycerol glycerophosphotransferase (TagB/SpsB family)